MQDPAGSDIYNIDDNSLDMDSPNKSPKDVSVIKLDRREDKLVTSCSASQQLHCTCTWYRVNSGVLKLSFVQDPADSDIYNIEDNSPNKSPRIRKATRCGAMENSTRTSLSKAGISGIMISGFSNGKNYRKLLPADVVRSLEEIDDCQVNSDHARDSFGINVTLCCRCCSWHATPLAKSTSPSSS